MKKVLSMLLAVALLLMAVPVGVMPVAAATGNTTEFAGGSGTAEDPYLIETKYHLNNVRLYLDAHFKMIGDIDFTEEDFIEGNAFYNNGTGWKPIDGFCGTFDGAGFLVNNLYSCGTQGGGLFGKILCSSSTKSSIRLKNITLANCKISGTSDVGGIVNYIQTYNDRYVFLTNCFVSGEITGTGTGVGGICGGYSYYYRNDDSGPDIAAFSKCYNAAKVVGDMRVGGIVGFVGTNTCYADVLISQCCNVGEVSGNQYVGGVIGYTHGYESSWDPNLWVSGSTVSNSFNAGVITGTKWVGGIVGRIEDGSLHIPQTYSVGSVNSTMSGSGLVGGMKTSGGSYYKEGYFLYDGNDAVGDTFGYSKTSDALKNQSTYNGWDFEKVWTMEGDEEYPYPELRCFRLSGTLGVAGNCAYSSTVTPDVSKLTKVDNTFVYNWYVDGELIYTGKSYYITADDVGKALKLEVISTHCMNAGSLYSSEKFIGKATQTAQPIMPEIQYFDDCSIEIATVPTQEYSIDNINWQASGVFDGLDPNKEYTVYSRILENDLYLIGESTPVLTVTTDRRPLSGAVTISGTSRYGDTLTANVAAVAPANATYTYEWKANGVVIGTNKTYTITQADIGKNITVSVKGTGDFIGTLTSASVTATKTTVQLPGTPVVEAVTNTTVKLVAKNGYEYSKDKSYWQDSPLFENLSAATEYTFYQRVKETDTTFASKTSNGTKVVTLKNNVSAPEKPVVESITNSSVTLKKTTGHEYSMDGLTWQTSNVFRGLSPNTEYTFCQRIAENATNYASAQSGYAMAITLKNTIATPAAPTVQKATDSSVTLAPINGYEYSKDGTTWQKSNVFSGLTVLETYTFYQRVAETNTDYASSTSAATSFKVKYIAAKPSAPTLKEKTNNKIEVVANAGYEYSIDGKVWHSAVVFSNLNPNTTYSVYCRIPETDTHYSSVASNALVVTTLKNTATKPAAPVLSSKTDSSVTLVANSTYEYSKNGTNWQKSNVFSGLSPNTEYTFYQRKAETDTAYASEMSAVLTVRTPKKTVSAPAAPTLSQKTATSVTLVKVNGYEYSIDGATWQASNVFSGLNANTQYTFYQRVSETNTSYASAISAALKVTTPKHDVSTPGAPIAIRVSATTVTLAPYTGFEYSKDGATWQTENTFTDLTANTTYTFYQRVAETSDTNASAKSAACNAKTAPKTTCSITPAKPIIAEVTTNKVVLVAREGYEYSKNGTTWQSSTTFSGLSADTSYTFYQRIAESNTELAGTKSTGITTKTRTSSSGVTSITNYQALQNYILRNGYTNSKGRKYIEKVRTSSGFTHTLQVIDTVDGLWFLMDSEKGELLSNISFTLSSTSKSFTVSHMLLTDMDVAQNKLVLDRTTISGDSWYVLQNGGLFQVTASDATDIFNPQLQLLFAMFEEYYLQLGFGLKGLGFTAYDVIYEPPVCDPLSAYHAGETEKRNAYSAACVTNGYTGDTYCSSCGEKIASGSAISCSGSHTYSNSCDKTCNTCGEERRIDHTYSNDCDTSCNVCGAERETIEHIFDDACDVHCNACQSERKAPHIFDNSKDVICNVCGYERPPYTPGDLDENDMVTDADAVLLLMYTFFPDDYSINQPCDYNGDGETTDADAVYLLMYTFFPEDYPIE